MTENGINFLGKHSYYDLNYHVQNENKEIGDPSKVKMVIRPTYSNHEYDFSDLYGSQIYENRSLKYPFIVVDKYSLSRENMLIEKRKLMNWLMNSKGKQKLFDDEYPGYYFLAEVISGADFQDDWETGIVTVTFDAYPFMISELPEGHDIWDDFNFELDIAQSTSFEIRGSTDIVITNVGITDLFPIINASSNFTIETATTNYKINAGISNNEDLSLKNGDNHLRVIGSGTIAFEFYKEMI